MCFFFFFWGCIKVPGRNYWTEPSSELVVNRCVDCTSQQREKRRRMDDEPVDHMDMLVSSIPAIVSKTNARYRIFHNFLKRHVVIGALLLSHTLKSLIYYGLDSSMKG